MWTLDQQRSLAYVALVDKNFSFDYIIIIIIQRC